jgi:hypothetical protein
MWGCWDFHNVGSLHTTICILLLPFRFFDRRRHAGDGIRGLFRDVYSRTIPCCLIEDFLGRQQLRFRNHIGRAIAICLIDLYGWQVR